MKKGSRFAAALAVTVSACSIAASMGCSAAQAQTVGSSDEAEAKDIIVTGSRIARQGFDTPNPVTVFGSQDAQKLGLTSTSDIVAQLPQNSAFVSSANVGQGNFNIGASLGNLRGLNPFYGTRTLTLVDSKRFVPTTDGGAVDLNVVPSILIKRVETVTGGASATYGSDAVAGVINILLDTRLTGFKAQIDDGGTVRGDGGDYHATAAWGTSFAGDRGHVLFGGEFEHQSPIGRCADVRSWCATNSALITNPGYATNGQPHYILASGVRQVTSSSGLFPLIGQQFNAAGTALTPYAFGQYPNTFGYPATMIGGADAAQDLNAGLTLRPKLERYALAGHLEYEFGDALHAYVEGFFAHRDALNRQVASGASVFYNVVSPDNV
jgi:outer membrane receptor protein involved in Fe transport